MSKKNFNIFRKFVNTNLGKAYSSKDISQATGLGVGEVANYAWKQDFRRRRTANGGMIKYRK